MPISIIPVAPEHFPALASICYRAFGTLQERHGVEKDFDSVETAGMVIGLFGSRPDFAGFAARDDATGKLLGSNFLQFSDPVAGVGPITIDPDDQSRGLGRRLMRAVLDEAARRGIAQVRLMQECINTASLSLYTKLGFDWRECCVMMRIEPAATDDPRIRPLTAEDLPAVDRLSTAQYGSTRVNEIAALLKIQFPGFVLDEGRGVAGYFVPGLIGHGFATRDEHLAALITHAGRHAPPMFHKFLLPLGEHNLHRLLLDARCRTIKMFNYMTTGPYERPTGAWVPSIGM